VKCDSSIVDVRVGSRAQIADRSLPGWLPVVKRTKQLTMRSKRQPHRRSPQSQKSRVLTISSPAVGSGPVVEQTIADHRPPNFSYRGYC
jgi:hypothetical protein